MSSLKNSIVDRIVNQFGANIHPKGVEDLKLIEKHCPLLFEGESIRSGFIAPSFGCFQDQFFLDLNHYEESKQWQSSLILIFNKDAGIESLFLLPTDSNGICVPIQETDLEFLTKPEEIKESLDQLYKTLKEYIYPIADHVVSDFSLWHYTFIKK